ncbi:CBS domain-containing protein [Thermopolyspora sp. NPDC052614]|uniref:CBS domain-containing protein n=1 Tax=Thermopolyspora sp. NPDC052614 TaxID=3155682 RepID=UPI00344885DD
MNIEELFRLAAKPTPADIDAADHDLGRAMTSWNADPRERHRISDLADLLDAEDVLYEQAVAAMERGDLATAETLLRQCVRLGIPAAEDLLEDVGQQRESEVHNEADQPAAASVHAAHLGVDEPHQVTDGELHQDSLLVSVDLTKIDIRVPSVDRVAATQHLLVAHGPSSSEGWLRSMYPRRSGTSLFALLQRRRCADLVMETDAGIVFADCKRYGDIHDNPYQIFFAVPMMCQGKTEAALRVARYFSCTSRMVGPLEWNLLRDVVTHTRHFASAQRSAAPARVAGDVLLPYDIPALAPADRVGDAIEQMAAAHEQALPVYDDGVVVGILTLIDGLDEALHDRALVSDIMHRPVYVSIDDPIDLVRDRLIASSTGLLVALKEGVVAGYITPITALAGHAEARQPFSPVSPLIDPCDLPGVPARG